MFFISNVSISGVITGYPLKRRVIAVTSKSPRIIIGDTSKIMCTKQGVQLVDDSASSFADLRLSIPARPYQLRLLWFGGYMEHFLIKTIQELFNRE